MTISDIYKDLVIMPEESRKLAHEFIENIAKQDEMVRGISSGLGNLDKILNPLGDSELRVIMGRPSAGKSGLIMHFTRMASAKWAAEKIKSRTPPIVISAEMAVEEIMLREISHYIPVDSMAITRGELEDWKAAHDTIDAMTEQRPIIYVGHSLRGERKRPRMSVENIWRSLEYIQDEWGKKPVLVSLDYAQRLKLDKTTRDRRMEISEIVETVKDMALSFATPVILGSQVGRQVDDRRPPVPDLSDAKESGSLEETADSVLSVMRPIKYYAVGEKIPGTDLDCQENLFFINILKQRQGISGKGIWVWFDFSITRIADLEVERVSLEY